LETDGVFDGVAGCTGRVGETDDDAGVDRVNGPSAGADAVKFHTTRPTPIPMPTTAIKSFIGELDLVGTDPFTLGATSMPSRRRERFSGIGTPSG